MATLPRGLNMEILQADWSMSGKKKLIYFDKKNKNEIKMYLWNKNEKSFKLDLSKATDFNKGCFCKKGF